MLITRKLCEAVMKLVEREIQKKSGTSWDSNPQPSRQMLLSLSYWNPDDREAEIGVGESKLFNLSLVEPIQC